MSTWRRRSSFLLDAQNNVNAAEATLSAVLGFQNLQSFQLVEDSTPITQPPDNVDDLISSAFTMRPEILALEFQSQSAQRFQRAERDLLFPDIRALGVVGDHSCAEPRDLQLVWRGRCKRRHSGVQWLPVYRESP